MTPEEKAMKHFQEKLTDDKVREINRAVNYAKEYFPDAVHKEDLFFTYGDLILEWNVFNFIIVGYGVRVSDMFYLGQFLSNDKPNIDYWRNLSFFGKIRHICYRLILSITPSIILCRLQKNNNNPIK
jgi:hypothetical protein